MKQRKFVIYQILGKMKWFEIPPSFFLFLFFRKNPNFGNVNDMYRLFHKIQSILLLLPILIILIMMIRFSKYGSETKKKEVYISINSIAFEYSFIFHSFVQFINRWWKLSIFFFFLPIGYHYYYGISFRIIIILLLSLSSSVLSVSTEIFYRFFCLAILFCLTILFCSFIAKLQLAICHFVYKLYYY